MPLEVAKACRATCMQLSQPGAIEAASAGKQICRCAQRSHACASCARLPKPLCKGQHGFLSGTIYRPFKHRNCSAFHKFLQPTPKLALYYRPQHRLLFQLRIQAKEGRQALLYLLHCSTVPPQTHCLG